MTDDVYREAKKELLPCPFCGAGVFDIRLNGRVWTGSKYTEPTAVEIMHWCEEVKGQPSRPISRIGRDLESAVRMWNMRKGV
jgi:hypothetical protein